MKREIIFRNCNVCGRELVRDDEFAVGMCAICANEEIPDEKPKTIPFHRARFHDDLEQCTLTNGEIYKLENGSRVEVWKIKDRDGLAFRFFRQTKDGKTSKLFFGLTPDACYALSLCLNAHLSTEP